MVPELRDTFHRLSSAARFFPYGGCWLAPAAQVLPRGREGSTQGPRPTYRTAEGPSPEQVAVARRMRDSGEPVPIIAATFGVSRAAVYRLLAGDEQKAS